MFEELILGYGEWVDDIKLVAPQIVCQDGTTLSVQASNVNYCSPKGDLGPYTHVEVGYLSCDPMWDEFNCGENIYAQVPVELVREFIGMHGGEV